MILDSIPDPPSNRTTLSFVDDEIKEALIMYAEAQGYSFCTAESNVFVLYHRYEDRHRQNVTQLIVDQEGSVEPTIKQQI